MGPDTEPVEGLGSRQSICASQEQRRHERHERVACAATISGMLERPMPVVLNPEPFSLSGASRSSVDHA
jgi:hypothetical protein